MVSVLITVFPHVCRCIKTKTRALLQRDVCKSTNQNFRIPGRLLDMLGAERRALPYAAMQKAKLQVVQTSMATTWITRNAIRDIGCSVLCPSLQHRT